MTLPIFILGILTALGIAKYNESNKLFWILLTCFTLGFAGTKAVYDTFDGEDEQDSVSLNQAYPTQELPTMENAFVCIFDNISGLAPVKETSNPVGQVNTPDYVESLTTLSNVSGVTQGIYLHTLPNPPNTVEIVSDA